MHPIEQLKLGLIGVNYYFLTTQNRTTRGSRMYSMQLVLHWDCIILVFVSLITSTIQQPQVLGRKCEWSGRIYKMENGSIGSNI